jgi:hypothetical protein
MDPRFVAPGPAIRSIDAPVTDSNRLQVVSQLLAPRQIKFSDTASKSRPPEGPPTSP